MNRNFPLQDKFNENVLYETEQNIQVKILEKKSKDQVRAAKDKQ